MTRQLEAILMIAKHPLMKPIMMPFIDVECESIDFNSMVKGKSGGEKAAISWAFCIWKDCQVDADDGGDPDFNFCLNKSARDPFESFGVMDADLQAICLQALAHRHWLMPKLDPRLLHREMQTLSC